MRKLDRFRRHRARRPRRRRVAVAAETVARPRPSSIRRIATGTSTGPFGTYDRAAAQRGYPGLCTRSARPAIRCRCWPTAT